MKCQRMEKIVFLDILIVRNNNTLEAIVYRTKTHKGVYESTLRIFRAPNMETQYIMCNIYKET